MKSRLSLFWSLCMSLGVLRAESNLRSTDGEIPNPRVKDVVSYSTRFSFPGGLFEYGYGRNLSTDKLYGNYNCGFFQFAHFSSLEISFPASKKRYKKLVTPDHAWINHRQDGGTVAEIGIPRLDEDGARMAGYTYRFITLKEWPGWVFVRTSDQGIQLRGNFIKLNGDWSEFSAVHPNAKITGAKRILSAGGKEYFASPELNLPIKDFSILGVYSQNSSSFEKMASVLVFGNPENFRNIHIRFENWGTGFVVDCAYPKLNSPSIFAIGKLEGESGKKAFERFVANQGVEQIRNVLNTLNWEPVFDQAKTDRLFAKLDKLIREAENSVRRNELTKTREQLEKAVETKNYTAFSGIEKELGKITSSAALSELEKLF